MKNLKILSSDEGRIKRIVIQSGFDGNIPVADLIRVHRALFGAFIKNCAEDLQIILIAQGDFTLGTQAAGQQFWDALRTFAESGQVSHIDQILVLTPDFDMKKYVSEWVRSGLVFKGTTEDAMAFFRFIQDPFLVLEGLEGAVALLEPYYCWSGGRSEDPVDRSASSDIILSKFVPEILTSLLPTPIFSRSTPWYFQGGNILASGRFAFVGEDIVRKNLFEFETTLLPFGTANVDDFAKSFAKILGVDYLIFPGWDRENVGWPKIPSQPDELFHLDLWLTCAGKTDEDKHLVFVAQLHVFDAETGEWGPSVAGSDPNQQYLDDAAERLRNFSNHGIQFHVERLPLLKFLEEDRAFKLLSYSNCIVEVGDGVKQIFMPVFANYVAPDLVDTRQHQLVKGDDLATKILSDQKFGFTVIPVDNGARQLAKQKAGLHCQVLVLERG